MSTSAVATSVGTTVADVAGVCAALRTAGYESRKAMVDAYVASTGDTTGLRAECGADLDRLEAARAIEMRRDAVLATAPVMEIHGFSCFDGRYQASVTNSSAEPLGVHLRLAFRWTVGEQLVVSADEPVVVWRLEPGATTQVSGTYEYEPVPGVDCTLSGKTFLADESPADASLGPGDPAFGGDDPATWLPALIRAEYRAIGSGNPDDAATIEDVRSSSYPGVVDSTDQRPVVAPDVDLQICSDGVRQPSANLAMVTFWWHAEPTPETDERDGVARIDGVRTGVFRRGGDGQWRWLGQVLELRSDRLTERCAPGPGDG